jgi:hypothetical protein
MNIESKTKITIITGGVVDLPNNDVLVVPLVVDLPNEKLDFPNVEPVLPNGFDPNVEPVAIKQY